MMIKLAAPENPWGLSYRSGTIQPLAPGLLPSVWKTATPVDGSATADTSATVRLPQPGSVCHAGFGRYAEQPLPELAVNSNAQAAVARAAPEAPTMRPPQIAISDLNAWFGSAHVLRHISFNVPSGSVMGIIGPSGCGKSTFVRCLNRMHELTPGARSEGKVVLDGKDVYGEDPVDLRRRVGMVFQRPNPFPKSIFDNAAFGLRMLGMNDREQLVARVEQGLRRAALWDEVKDRLDRSALQLSGGQQQRLCIARTVAVKPEVILFDEPCSALDPISTAKIEELIDELKEDYTIVIVTHNMQQAARVSDFTAFMYLGELIEFDTTSKMFTAPTDRRTQDYITGRFG